MYILCIFKCYEIAEINGYKPTCGGRESVRGMSLYLLNSLLLTLLSL